jgi:hypothetical protein
VRAGAAGLSLMPPEQPLKLLEGLALGKKVGGKKKSGSLSPCSDLNVHLYVIGIVVII